MKSKAKPCQTCASIDPNLSSRQNAKRLGISKTTVNNHLAAQMQGKHAPTTATAPKFQQAISHDDVVQTINDNDDFFTDIPQEIITSRGKSTRLADGSWEKISYQPNKMAIIEASRTTYEDLLPHLQDLSPTHTPQSSHSPDTPHSLHTLHFNAADLQIGKAGQRGGGTPETLEKVRRALRKTTEQIRALPAHLRPDEIVVIDNGDPIENIFNTPQQAHTNDLNLADQIRTFRRLMLEILKAFIALKDDEYNPKITYVAVPSNHGEVRSGQGRGMRAGTTDADFGLEIQSQIEDAFELLQSEAGGHPLVHFVRPEPGFSTAVHTTIDGTKVAYNHGHLSRGGQNGHGKWWASQDHGRLPGWDSDILVVAHYHNFRVEQSGNGRWIIGVSSPDPGSDWFTDSSGESAVSGITTFETSQGVWRNLQIV